MIDYKDLRVGNKVYYDTGEGNEVCTIDGTDISVMESRENYAKRHSPIPLTPEILLACGFEIICHVGDDICWQLGSVDIWQRHLSHIPDYFVFKNKETQVRIIPLHQLQNLYYALTGTELNYTPKQ